MEVTAKKKTLCLWKEKLLPFLIENEFYFLRTVELYMEPIALWFLFYRIFWINKKLGFQILNQ